MYTKSQLTQGSFTSSTRTFGDKKHFYLLIYFWGKSTKKINCKSGCLSTVHWHGNQYNLQSNFPPRHMPTHSGATPL